MRVLIINTSERTGGAAVAAQRLCEALNNNGVKAKMMVRDKETDDITVVGTKNGWRAQASFLWERWCVYCHLHFSRKHLWEIDIANAGTDITKTREFREADVIHLSWINQGMLSLKTIRKILRSKKAVVWTMHDLWPATAICHYARGCERFKSRCSNCPLLPGKGSKHDLAAKTWQRKARTLAHYTISFVGCSRWLTDQAKQSALLRGQQVTCIPNPINNHIYKPVDKDDARRRAGLPSDCKIILFVSQKVTDQRKGLSYFKEALDKLAESHPEEKGQIAVAILGGHAEEVGELPFETFPMGYVNDTLKLIQIYNAADVYVLPSLEDNLPNTIMEAMACGVPSVGFYVGGIPEMIDHTKNGYVAQVRNANDLAKGIYWVLREADAKALSDNALHKVSTMYSQQAVAMKYIEVYNQALALKRYHI